MGKKCSPTPCSECPFRKTAPKGWLGDGDVKEGLDSYKQYIAFGTPVTCHMHKENLCKGMIHFMNNKSQRSRVPAAQKLQDEWKDDKANAELVFNNTKEFIDHHER